MFFSVSELSTVLLRRFWPLLAVVSLLVYYYIATIVPSIVLVLVLGIISILVYLLYYNRTIHSIHYEYECGTGTLSVVFYSYYY